MKKTVLKLFAEAVVERPESAMRSRVLGAALRRIDGVPVRSRYGVVMRTRSHDLTNYYCISGENHVDYDDVFSVVSTIRPGMAFFDIGANAGLFSMVAGKRLGPDGVIVAFEPSPRTFHDLVANAVANGLANFHPFCAALGLENGVARFDSGNEGHSGAAHFDGQGKMFVTQMRFADMWPSLRELIGDRKIMVKIDVEGAEDIVLTSIADLLASGQIETCIVEVDQGYLERFGSSAAALYAKLEAVGLKPRLGLGTRPHYNEVFERQG
ncbi:methyltransferase, FkbM family [Sphingomonas laterariae]|uniref:Methyltransferase, FkbM family n=1 Tax=Edaphosphingomonas laterariae TaxID=861865 RepID=A0A239DLU8_9SPHN|nr:FkbM family methyltransferase [Sphingomonas laterariae]SNS32782.1 methyltransferase, FkbM family [Sphingomonas laterariae]